MKNYFRENVRDKAILTTSYVAGTLLDGPTGTGLDCYNQLILDIDFTIGSLTTAEVKIEFSDELRYTLAYDGQTANFTAGKTITGQTSGVFAEIISDTDGGATGTLIIGKPKGTKPNITAFIDNETIKDNNTTAGTAVVNGVIALDDTAFFQQTASSISSGTSTDTLLAHQFSASGRYRIAVPIKDRFVRVSAKGTGTVTGSLMGIKATIGTV